MSDETRSLVAAASAALPAPAEWQTMARIADVLITSGLLPAHIKTPQAALAIMLKARELGVSTMHGLSTIVVVQGKPTCNGELMLALIYRDQGDDAIIITQTTAERCTISYKRRGWTERQTYSFTMEDARRAGLSSGQTWQKYPAAMLRARCISAVARMAFPDAIAGMYGYEELGVSVAVEDGQVVLAEQDATGPAEQHEPRQQDEGDREPQTQTAPLRLREAPIEPREGRHDADHTPTAPAALEPAEGFVAAAAEALAAAQGEPAQTERAGAKVAVDPLATLRAEVVALCSADGAALDLLRTRAGGKVPQDWTEEQLRKALPWLRKRIAPSAQLSARIAHAHHDDEILALLKEADQAKVAHDISQVEYLGLHREAQTRKAALSGPLTAQVGVAS